MAMHTFNLHTLFCVEGITHAPAKCNSISFYSLEDPNKNCFSRKLITLKSSTIVRVVLKVMPSYMYWTTE